MNYFRLSPSINIKEVGAFPQIENLAGELSVDAPNHLYNQEMFAKYTQDLYVPTVHLRTKATLTDNLSPEVKTDFVISEKFKNLILQQGIEDVEFKEITVVHKSIVYTYYLLHFLKPKYQCVNFSLTDIYIMETTWEVDQTIRVKSNEEFIKLVDQIQLPRSIQMGRPYFKENCAENMFALRYAYSGFQLFVSDKTRKVFEDNGITGVRYRDLDEV